jgi:hypothetical protein
MAENTKMPPNQDQRSRTPSSKPGEGKPQKSGGPIPSGTGPDRDRQGVNNPGKPTPEIDPDRGRPDRTKSVPEDLDDDGGPTGPIDRE